jgi:5-methylcytosine-specific restriction endonuclease McrA
MEKVCKRCNSSKPVDSFGKDRHARDGLYHWCKECQREDQRVRRAANPDHYRRLNREQDARRREKRKEYRALKRDERRKYNADWQKNNPEKYRAKQRRWAEKNREKANAINRTFLKNNPQKRRAYRDAYYEKYPEKLRLSRIARMERRRARMKAAEGDFTPADIQIMLIEQQYRCYACNIDITNSYSVDHIVPLVLGGSNHLSNIELLCQSCNSSKGGKSPLQWHLETGKRVKGLVIDNEQAA